MSRVLLSALMVLFCRPLWACDQPQLSVSSPDEKIRLMFCTRSGVPSYAVEVDGRPAMTWSAMGFELKDRPQWRNNFRVTSSLRRASDSTWEQPWGEEQFIRNHYNEMTVSLTERGRHTMQVIFRVFNDGIGFRYVVPEQPGLKNIVILNELTEFNFLADHAAWPIEAYTERVYEQVYEKKNLSHMPVSHTPLTIEAGELYFSLHEAALVDYSSMQIKSRGEGGRLVADLAPAADGTKVKTQTPMLTPWRTLQIARRPGDLITSYLILNLNEPSRLKDTSWIKPTKYMGIWWAMHLGKWTWEAGARHGATTQNTKDYIDAAASLGIPALLVEGWNLGWENWTSPGSLDYLRSYPDFDLQEVTRYGREKGIEIIGHHETAGAVRHYENQMSEAFKLYQGVGVRSVKTGYVKFQIEGEYHYGQAMVRHYQRVIDEAARHHIMINAHEPVKDTGLRRTYPNFMTREGGRGAEYDAWDGPVGNPPSHAATLPFTRSLSGPFDYTPGIFDIMAGSRSIDRVHTTLAKQLALYVTIYSPMQMAADLPENYMGHPAFQFIRDVPVDWFTTKVLTGQIGEHVTIVRRDRNSTDWYLGSVTNEQARELTVSLDFLDTNTLYCAEIYRDADDTHWENNPTSYQIERREYRSTDQLTLKLAPGGGQAIRFAACGSSR